VIPVLGTKVFGSMVLGTWVFGSSVRGIWVFGISVLLKKEREMGGTKKVFLFEFSGYLCEKSLFLTFELIGEKFENSFLWLF